MTASPQPSSFLSRLVLLLLAAGGFALSAEPEPLPEPPVPQQELSAAISNCTREQAAFAAEVQQVEQDLPRLGELAPCAFDPAAPMPEAPPGHSAVVADGGLLYDNARSSLSYLGNVRLNDERVQLRAAHRLYIRLPEHGAGKAEPASAAQAPAKPAAAPAAATRPRAAKAPAKHTPPAAPATPAAQPPAHIIAENAAVDLLESRSLLEGRSSTPSLTITRGEDSLLMDPAAGASAAIIYAGAGGDVLLLGRNIRFRWRDAEGAQWLLTVTNGPVYYQAARHCLIALGESCLSSPSYNMQSQRALYIVFAPEEGQAAAAAEQGNKPFSQFTTLRFKDIEYANAYGNVRLSSAAGAGGDAPSTLCGEALRYEAASGECRVYGSPCALEYGANTMQAPGTITLLGNGDILINAPTITGNYERPFDTTPQGGQTTRGTYTAPGPIRYSAESNSVTLPGGIQAVDAHGAFSCRGQLVAYLAERPGSSAPKPPRPGMRLPNLAIARQGGVSRFTAEGSVRLRSEASATTPAYKLECDKLEADVAIGTASLRTAAGRRLLARYGGYLLTAQSQPGGDAQAHLLSNGDISVAAAAIHATMPGKDGPTRIDCTESLQLQRSLNLLTLGPESRLASPSGILTARAELQALLAEADPPATPPSHQQKYPHLAYNYSGLRRATTPAGGSLRSPQASLECEGPISFELKPDAQLQDGADARSIIRHASAQKHVQVAGKDADGRLMRASGDRLDFEADSGNFLLRGSSVTLVDEYNSHTASGKGACITIDPQNNVYITGENHITTATQLKLQMDKQKKK